MEVSHRYCASASKWSDQLGIVHFVRSHPNAPQFPGRPTSACTTCIKKGQSSIIETLFEQAGHPEFAVGTGPLFMEAGSVISTGLNKYAARALKFQDARVC